MTDSSAPRIEVNGRTTEADPLLFEMMSGQGHFTAMQVRGGRVRGLDLHLDRLDAATRELFGAELDGELVRGRIRHALRERSQDAAVRVYVYHPEPGDGPVTVVTVRPPVPEPEAAQRLRSVAYQRPAAHLKHLGGFGQRYHLSRVQQEGFDEALLVAPDGAVAEGAITNIGFVKDETVIWPDAPALPGITMLVLRRELDRAGMPVDTAPGTHGRLGLLRGGLRLQLPRGCRRLGDRRHTVSGGYGAGAHGAEPVPGRARGTRSDHRRAAVPKRGGRRHVRRLDHLACRVCSGAYRPQGRALFGGTALPGRGAGRRLKTWATEKAPRSSPPSSEPSA